MDRIGVLIGHKGETKKDLEERTGLKIDIDSNAGEVVIDDHEAADPLMIMKTENIIKAIGRGFSPEKAWILMNDDADFFIFDLHDYVGKKEAHVRRLKSRIGCLLTELFLKHICLKRHSHLETGGFFNCFSLFQLQSSSIRFLWIRTFLNWMTTHVRVSWIHLQYQSRPPKINRAGSE